MFSLSLPLSVSLSFYLSVSNNGAQQSQEDPVCCASPSGTAGPTGCRTYPSQETDSSHSAHLQTAWYRCWRSTQCQWPVTGFRFLSEEAEHLRPTHHERKTGKLCTRGRRGGGGLKTEGTFSQTLV